MGYSNVQVAREGPVATLSVTRPARLPFSVHSIVIGRVAELEAEPNAFRSAISMLPA